MLCFLIQKYDPNLLLILLEQVFPLEHKLYINSLRKVNFFRNVELNIYFGSYEVCRVALF